MTADFTRGQPNTPLERPAVSEVVRWLLALFFVVLALVLVAVFAVALFAFRQWTEIRIAAKGVEKEVTRLQLAGEPMTVEDLYRYHAVPKNVVDTTPAWLAARQSYNPARLYQDGKPLPFVGDGDAVNLRSADSQLAAAEEFLSQYSPSLQAIFTAAQQSGECRYPFKFGQFGVVDANDSQGIRTIIRLLALHAHVKAIRSQNEEAIASLAAMFAASDTLSQQLSIVEHLIRLATLGSAMSQTEFLLNEAQMSDDELARLAHQVEASDIQGSFTRALIGERARGYLAFQQQTGAWRSADCLKYLEMLKGTIAFSAESLPDGRNHMRGMLDQFEAQERAAAASLARNNHVLTAQTLPSLTSAFDAYCKATAYQRALVAAIAAERYRLKTGQFPSQLTDLVPDYLPAVPIDPFDGQPLRLRLADDEILIYSIGLDGKDDGASNPPGNSREPDIVVRFSSAKARH